MQGILYEPDQKTDKIIIHVHGMAGNFYENRFLDYMAKTNTDNGWAFLAFNNRGHDFIADFPTEGDEEKYKRGGNFREKFEECLLDIKPWVDLAEEKGFEEIILQGHSLGCVKIAYYQVKVNDKRVSKLIMVSPPDMVGLAEKEGYHQELMEQSRKMVEEGKGKEILPKLIWDWYYLSANTYLDFHTRDNPIDVFNIYDKEKESILSEIKLPVLAIMGGKDAAATYQPQEDLDIIGNKSKDCPQFDKAVVEGASHSYFAHEQELADLILNWIKND